MTRAAAIKWIKDALKTTDFQYEQMETALEMAISALEQEPYDLLIIKSDLLLNQDDRKKWMERFKREKEGGVIILPPYFEPLLVPNDIEINIEQGSCEWSRMTFDAATGISVFEFSDGTIKQVKQAEIEQCEDCVSRQAVNEIVNDIRDCISVEGYWAILERMKKLPSVTPSRPQGRWEKEKDKMCQAFKNGLFGATTEEEG